MKRSETMKKKKKSSKALAGTDLEVSSSSALVYVCEMGGRNESVVSSTWTQPPKTRGQSAKAVCGKDHGSWTRFDNASFTPCLCISSHLTPESPRSCATSEMQFLEGLMRSDWR